MEAGVRDRRLAPRRLPDSWIVEIGSHHGRSTTVLAAGKHDKVRPLAIDPFNDPRWGGGTGEFKANMAKLDVLGIQRFRGLSDESAAASRGHPIGLFSMDEAHNRASVLQDIGGQRAARDRGGATVQQFCLIVTPCLRAWTCSLVLMNCFPGRNHSPRLHLNALG